MHNYLHKKSPKKFKPPIRRLFCLFFGFCVAVRVDDCGNFTQRKHADNGDYRFRKHERAVVKKRVDGNNHIGGAVVRPNRHTAYKMANETHEADGDTSDGQLGGGTFQLAFEHTAEAETAESDDVIGERNDYICTDSVYPSEIFKSREKLIDRQHKGGGNAVLYPSTVGINDDWNLCENAEASAVGIGPREQIRDGEKCY